MNAHAIAMTGRALDPASAVPERVREVALGALAALLGVVFLLLLAADQARVAVGAL